MSNWYHFWNFRNFKQRFTKKKNRPLTQADTWPNRCWATARRLRGFQAQEAQRPRQQLQQPLLPNRVPALDPLPHRSRRRTTRRAAASLHHVPSQDRASPRRCDLRATRRPVKSLPSRSPTPTTTWTFSPSWIWIYSKRSNRTDSTLSSRSCRWPRWIFASRTWAAARWWSLPASGVMKTLSNIWPTIVTVCCRWTRLLDCFLCMCVHRTISSNAWPFCTSLVPHCSQRQTRATRHFILPHWSRLFARPILLSSNSWVKFCFFVLKWQFKHC